MKRFRPTAELLLPFVLGSFLLLFSGGLFANAQRSLPPCRYDDVTTFHMGYDDWKTTLLDTLYSLPVTYVPPDLVSVEEAGLDGPFKVRALLLEDLKALVAAAPAGAGLELQSAYRSYDYQRRTFEYWVAQEGADAALTSSARAGHSEHQLGTAVDFRSVGGPAPWDLDDWALTPAGAWLAENAWRYGFVMSYPEGKRDLTCYIYEPWHYRYVGRETAKAVKESGLTLREWLWEKQ